jgi:hypothetical protein
VFAAETTQEHVYEKVAQPLVGSLMKQEAHGLIFTFGVTNSGKTFTIQGSKEQPGILPRVLQTVFNSILKTGPAEKRFPVDDANYKYAVVVNYMEIYNELIFDLLGDYSKANMEAEKEALQLKMDSKGRVGVRGLKEETVSSVEMALQVLERGRENRRMAETKLNTDSSRSHSIFTIKLCMVPKEHVVKIEDVRADPTKYVRYTKLSVIDLAGSERAKRTNNQGARLVEAANINQSLMTFHRCMDALRHNQQHPNRPQLPVPFRESKMTRLFQDYFMGTGRAAMIVNINPQYTDYDESARVLRFCTLAQELKTTVTRIDTGRVTKTKARTNGEGFEGGLVAVAAVASTPTQSARPTTTAAAKLKSKKEEADAAKAASESDAKLRDASAEITRLQLQLAEAAALSVRLEAEIREEVATEFAQEIFRNQLQCEERVMEIRDALEEKYEKKIEILDQLNKTNMQRHALKYQELVAEYDSLADECDEKEAQMQKRLDDILSAKSSGSTAKYNELIKNLEGQVKSLTSQVAVLESAKQQWKKQVGQIAETRILNLERENAELKEENRQLKDNGKKTVKNMWGLKKKQRSHENLNQEDEEEGELTVPPQPPSLMAAVVAEKEREETGWANVSLDVEDDKQQKGNKEKKKFGGSWRKKRGNAQISEVENDAAAPAVAPAAVMAQPRQPKRQESDSLLLTEMLNLPDNALSKNALVRM